MLGGYMGKILLVNLSTREIHEERPEDKLYRDFIGGYGIGSRILYSKQKGGVEPLGPENNIGFVTGPLTGTPALFGCRYAAVSKSPLTGGWGDANSGGYFGPYLKFAGYDAVFFTGIADKPVYLLINDGKAELRDAGHLWGRDTNYTEDTIQAEVGKGVETVSIGRSGEKLSLISCILTRGTDAAGRSGLGAVMGSKKLKAVAVKGNQKVTIADTELTNKFRKEHLDELKAAMYGGKPFIEQRRKYGTTTMTHLQAHSGDAPVKNWGGIGIVDFPDSSGLSGDSAVANVEKRTGCWRCPLTCKGILKEGTGDYNYPAGTARPEYETQGSFGSMCLNNDTESIAMANYICNSYGIDTISAGTTIAFAIECYENGIITKGDTDGIELTWGNHKSIIAMTEKMAKREGFGDILADGVKVAAEKIGKGAEQFAVQIGGQELAMHDPKLSPDRPAAARYYMNATPGRHTQGFGPSGFQGHITNTAGLCVTGFFAPKDPGKYIAGYLSAVTGFERSMDNLLKVGERIDNMRHVFNLREGLNPLDRKIHPRILGNPPPEEGPLAGVTIDLDAQIYPNLDILDWDRKTTIPGKKKLLELGLDDVAKDVWP